MRVTIVSFPSGVVADDGLTVSVEAKTSNDKDMTLVMPFDQLDWLTQALISLGNGAFTKQIEAGTLSRSNPINAAMVAESFRVLPHSSGTHAIVQMTGKYDANAPVGMGSFQISAELVQSLAERLREVADELSQRGRPS